MNDEEFAKKEQELLDQVPIEFHHPIRTMAWEQGHSGGHSEILNMTIDLVHNLKPHINMFRDRIEAEIVERERNRRHYPNGRFA
jgi:predicted lipase